MLEKFEKNINEIKEKIGNKALGVAMFCIFGVSILFGMNMANVYGREKQNTTDTYNKAMYELITNVNNVDILVDKIRITTTKEYNIQALAKVMAEANSAKDNLSGLPVNQNSMGNVSKFLSQVIGYSEALIKKLSGNGEISHEDHKNLEQINKVANNLNDTLQEIYTELNKGRIKWDEVERVATDKLNKNENELNLSKIDKIKESLENYTGLIYDGAFSNHIESSKPKSLSKNEVSVEKAVEKVKECVQNIFAGKENKIEEVIYNGELKGRLTAYTFEVKLKDTDYLIDVQITKEDGKLLLLMCDRKVEKQNITTEEAKKLGDKYMASIGVKDLQPTYYLTTDNMITINYAAKQDNVVLYPDLIKVKIALDDGQICSVETTGYIYNHIKRNDLQPKISMEDARKSVAKDLKINYSGLAIIPTVSNGEVLTYEFKGTVDNKEFLIYINSDTGTEENVLLILRTPGGVLTM